MTVDTCDYCTNCANKLYNSNNKIEIGIGSITSDTIIVLPRIYKKGEQERLLKLIKDIYLDNTNYNILERCYITIDIKCPKYNAFGGIEHGSKFCNKILNQELSRIPYRYMIIFGRAWKTVFPNNDNPKSFIYNNYRILYIPLNLSKLNDSVHINEIKTKLCQAINYFNKERYMR